MEETGVPTEEAQEVVNNEAEEEGEEEAGPPSSTAEAGPPSSTAEAGPPSSTAEAGPPSSTAEGTEVGSEGEELEEYYDELDMTTEGESEGDTLSTYPPSKFGEEGREEAVGEEAKEVVPQTKEEELMVEEEQYVEEPPPDPAAPYNLSDSKEALKAPFELSEVQLQEVKDLWDLYQDYTPAYAELKDYITVVELTYMMKALNLMTHTPEQLMELIEFCVRPPHIYNHVEFDHFVHIVTIRQRDCPVEEEIRLALEVLDPENSGVIEREQLREMLYEHGIKGLLTPKAIENFIREVDVTGDGTINIEDVVSTMCLDLNREDIVNLQNQINPPEKMDSNIDNLTQEGTAPGQTQ